MAFSPFNGVCEVLRFIQIMSALGPWCQSTHLNIFLFGFSNHDKVGE